MDVQDLLRKLQILYGPVLSVEAPASEDCRNREVCLRRAEEFFRLKTKKVRGFRENVVKRPGSFWSPEPRRGVVYAIKAPSEVETRHASGNYRTVYHGTSLVKGLSILEHGFLPSRGGGLLLGDGGVYVGNFQKALGYLKDGAYGIHHKRSSFHGLFRRPPNTRAPHYIQAEAAIGRIRGVMIRARADLGSVREIVGYGQSLHYKSVKDTHDTLTARAGSAVGGTVWGGVLKETEFVVDPKQLAPEEIYIFVQPQKNSRW